MAADYSLLKVARHEVGQRPTNREDRLRTTHRFKATRGPTPPRLNESSGAARVIHDAFVTDFNRPADIATDVLVPLNVALNHPPGVSFHPFVKAQPDDADFPRDAVQDFIHPFQAINFLGVGDVFVRPDCADADRQIMGQHFIEPKTLLRAERADCFWIIERHDAHVVNDYFPAASS
jgi:hypothetical protein